MNEGKVLNRLIRATESGWEIEADPRHAELVIEQLGLANEKPLSTPGVSGQEEDDLDDDEPLRGGDITSFRGVAARCNYLWPDRPDCNFAIKEGCREMSAPTTGPLRRLKRLGRYLKGNPRVVWRYDFQEPMTHLEMYTDADWAGCKRARKSTSGGVAMIGNHCIKAWAKTQSVIAKNSAESELYSVVNGATEAHHRYNAQLETTRTSRSAIICRTFNLRRYLWPLFDSRFIGLIQNVLSIRRMSKR